jgi:hypothetical protein
VSSWARGQYRERILGGEDGDALMGADGQQVPAVAGDDQFGVGGDGSGDDVIVIGIPLDHAGHVDGG